MQRREKTTRMRASVYSACLLTPPIGPTLRDVPHAIALEYGMTGKVEFKPALEAQQTDAPRLPDRVARHYQTAQDFIGALRT